MVESVECAVIGAGVIGLAVARALARAGREVVVLEAADAIGTGISARNSEVIHAGLYYPKDSLKARLCVEGRERLYEFCDSHGVEHKRLGKVVVATSHDQDGALRDLQERAKDNGVDDIAFLDQKALEALEPAVRGVAGLLSPSSGIVDSHGLMLALQGDGESCGAMIALNSPLVAARVEDDGFLLSVGGADPMELRCAVVVNAAGLGAQGVAGSIEGLAPRTIPPRYLAKGNYFALSGKAPFSRLIYPLPEAAGLGVHLTLDLGGQARFGPDVEWVEEEDYAVDPARAATFAKAIRRYWPDLDEGVLHPDYAGIRPKIQAPGAAAVDFVIQGSSDHGVQGLVNLYGIESPGLTSCLAIADAVIARL